ncbi:hypothetical protein Rhopal_001164-T1 [Rhodotorula paludigena]|uniref:DM2 domain-containing protein n=1 Tax=Rhodotorula paludigena TaxID=86838 RepID=A0AAV5GE88_9BASI|nr:hypothetical protein Rhopal_001164-T1 [Rhodotorula paludigena]
MERLVQDRRRCGQPAPDGFRWFHSLDARSAQTAILADADRDSITAKGVRRQLQAKYSELDVAAHKREIDEVIKDVFTGGGGDEQVKEEPTPAPAAEDVKPKLPSFTKLKRSRSPSASLDEPPASSPAFPLATSAKPNADEDADAAFARQLQAEFAAMSGGRTTRNGGSSSASSRKRAGGRKSKARVSDDDGESDDGAAKKKKKRKTGNSGFNKPHLLSHELAEVCGVQVASRPGVTKYLWRYIKANNLQDPKKKTDILPDEKLKAVSYTFKLVLPFNRINSFTMAKHIGAHLYEFDPEEHASLVPPPSDDEGAGSVKDEVDSDDDDSDKKPKRAVSTPTDKVGVRGSGRVLSKAEVDSEDDED